MALGFDGTGVESCGGTLGAGCRPPDAYTVTETNAMMGPPITMKIYRDGSRAIIDSDFKEPRGSVPRRALRARAWWTCSRSSGGG